MTDLSIVAVLLLLAMVMLTTASTHANVRCKRFTTCDACAKAPLPCDWLNSRCIDAKNGLAMKSASCEGAASIAARKHLVARFPLEGSTPDPEVVTTYKRTYTRPTTEEPTTTSSSARVTPPITLIYTNFNLPTITTTTTVTAPVPSTIRTTAATTTTTTTTVSSTAAESSASTMQLTKSTVSSSTMVTFPGAASTASEMPGSAPIQVSGGAKSNANVQSDSNAGVDNNADVDVMGGFPTYGIGLIVGVGVVALLVAIVIAFVLLKKSRQNRATTTATPTSAETADVTYAAPPQSGSDVYSPPPRACAYETPQSSVTQVYGSAPVIMGEYGAAPTLSDV